jgi:hypothetical protein
MLFVQPILWQLLRQPFFPLAFEIKIIKKEMSRERQNTIRVCERKLSPKLSKSGCTNIISLLYKMQIKWFLQTQPLISYHTTKCKNTKSKPIPDP